MKHFEIRTKDEVLKRALSCWWEEFAPRAPEGAVVILTDLDSEKAGGGGEITLSRSLPCHLRRPFAFEELEALILQKQTKERLLLSEKTVFLDGKPLSLSPLEKRLLTLLAERSAETPVSAEELSLALWGEVRASNQINVYIRYLRKKTDTPGKEGLIHTVRGRGYYLKNER